MFNKKRKNMKKLNLFLFVLLFQFVFVYCNADSGEADTIYVATWNVENLFDTVDEPGINDEDFTPSGENEWTEERLKQKFEKLAEVIKYMHNGEGPDLLGVQEVEHQSLLNEMNEEYLDEKYKIVYAESLDKRGIDNGLFYNSDLFELLSFDTLRVDLADGWLTRYILYANLEIKDSQQKLHVFVNHWPSRSGGKEKSEPNRIAAALVLKNYTDKIFEKDVNANIVILGDFNDDPTDVSIYEILKAQELECSDPGINYFYNTSLEKFKEGTGTYLYRGGWNMLDQIIVSRSLVETNDLDYVCDSFEIIKPDFMINKEGKYAGSAIRTFGGKKYIGGYSDHYPTGAKFTYKK